MKIEQKVSCLFLCVIEIILYVEYTLLANSNNEIIICQFSLSSIYVSHELQSILGSVMAQVFPVDLAQRTENLTSSQ